MTGTLAKSAPGWASRAIEVLSLMARHPLLTREEILDAMWRAGPVQSEVEQELARISSERRRS